MRKSIFILSGGTISSKIPHLALCSPAGGSTGARLYEYLEEMCGDKFEICLLSSALSGGSAFATNEDLNNVIEVIVQAPYTKIIFAPCAVCDFDIHPSLSDTRLSSSSGEIDLKIVPSKKLIKQIRKTRKDIFLVSFKHTHNATKNEMFSLGMKSLKENSSNLVFVNDNKNGHMILTPEEGVYGENLSRYDALKELCQMTLDRSHLTFTQSTVVNGDRVEWNSPEIPESLRTIVNFCIKQGAYKEVCGATSGHFAHKISDTEFITSIRRVNFNKLNECGMVKIKTDGPDTVLAYGAKPSVGGQSQRIIFRDHPDMDCVVHFHCPKKEGSLVNTVSQKEFECGSHECGINTSNGLMSVSGDIKCVYLDNHGPNIVFNRDIDPQLVIDFIKYNFDLTGTTSGYKYSDEK